MKNSVAKLVLFIFPLSVWAQADWTRGFQIETPRGNIYELEAQSFRKKVMEGRKHALFYPVTSGELLIPYKPLKDFFETPPEGQARKILYKLSKIISPFHSMEEVFSELGVHPYPDSPQPQTPNELPVLTESEKKLPMGATLISTDDGVGLTFSCAACHSSNLFGVKVLGLTNRFPKANELFSVGAKVAPYINSFLFQKTLNTTDGEREMFVETKHAMKYVGSKVPAVLGLDTSLAQVALSLAKRNKDPYAERGSFYHRFPRKNKLEKMVADSKPAVWWNVKYKNRWLSDGSIVSGNPVFTNFLWNEIGRGTDLHKLENWMNENEDKIEALTAAVFASEAPRYETFFGENSLDLQKAQRGEKHFIQSCQKCHGVYEKSWDSGPKTVRVIYHKDTPVKDVGTDSGRYLGMREFADDLNRLAISKAMGTVVEPQKGYVPPPLVGIWARWPYFHNNSIPNLCALLTVGNLRPKTYWAGAAINQATDFDSECVGYPLGDETPSTWKEDKDYFYDTSKQGLSNAGHDDRILVRDGVEIYSPAEKMELIEFLKTL